MAEGDDYRYPFGVTADEEGDDIVRVCVVILGLKSTLIGSNASNAVVNVQSEKQSLLVDVEMEKGGDKYRLNVKKLPHTIDKTSTSFKVKKDQVVIKLKKAPVRSWAKELAETGIDAYDSDEENMDGDSNTT